MPPQLSVVIPAYNEATRIVPTLRKIRQFIVREQLQAEIIVVDDGSTDGTADVVRGLIQTYESVAPIALIANDGNRGKGHSIRRGVLRSTGDHVLFTDSDLSSPIGEYHKLASALHRAKAAIAIGSRGLRESEIGIHQSWFRERFGRSSNVLVRWICGLPFKDTQCGFKLFTREAAQTIFPLQTVDGFGFDVEILYIAHRLGFPTVEVPVMWSHVEGSRVRLGDIPRTLIDVLRVRYQGMKGLYDRPGQP